LANGAYPKANRAWWAMQNDPQDENPIKKALRTWRALQEMKLLHKERSQ
jgi:hypothetical protein